MSHSKTVTELRPRYNILKDNHTVVSLCALYNGVYLSFTVVYTPPTDLSFLMPLGDVNKLVV